MCFAGCALLISAYPCQELIQKFRDLRFLIITNGQIDRAVRSDPLGIRLHVASHRDDHRFGVSLFGLVDHLAALSVGDVGDGTSVDHIYVRKL